MLSRPISRPGFKLSARACSSTAHRIDSEGDFITIYNSSTHDVPALATGHVPRLALVDLAPDQEVHGLAGRISCIASGPRTDRHVPHAGPVFRPSYASSRLCAGPWRLTLGRRRSRSRRRRRLSLLHQRVAVHGILIKFQCAFLCHLIVSTPSPSKLLHNKAVLRARRKLYRVHSPRCIVS